MKKIPYGIINYKELITEGFEYIDKTMYLEKLENIGKTLIYLRPGRFGKSLFTSMMFYYYDVNSKDEFDTLFGETYVGKNPTPKKNSYYVLKFDFSGISTETHDVETLKEKFKNKVIIGIEDCINYYHLDYEIEKEQSPEDILGYFLAYMKNATIDGHKVYIIIDEYDNFTNAILEGDAKDFLNAVGNTGFVKSFYSNIKIYVKEGIVDKFFATGICPITLNSMTTGFNIAKDISTDELFASMIGLTHEEVKTAIENIIQEGDKDEIFETMEKHYDGYLFNKKVDERVFNATLVMYFLSHYVSHNNTIPEELYDNNIVVNYGKIDNLLKLQDNSFYKEIIEDILKTDSITGMLKTQFNLQEDFTRDDIISLLYYFGYLTVKSEALLGKTLFKVPNEVMKMTYGNYFIKLMKDIDVTFENKVLDEAVLEMMEKGSVAKMTEYISEVMNSMGNRMFMNFDEKYIQQMYYVFLMNSKEFTVHEEYECSGGGYIDLYFEGNREVTPYDIIVELKYIKKGESDVKKLIEEKRLEGIEQLNRYDLDKDNLRKYLVVFVGREVKLLEEITK